MAEEKEFDWAEMPKVPDGALLNLRGRNEGTFKDLAPELARFVIAYPNATLTLAPDSTESAEKLKQRVLEICAEKGFDVPPDSLRIEDKPSIDCPRCGCRSYSRHDIEQKYCGHCHAFHADLRGA